MNAPAANSRKGKVTVTDFCLSYDTLEGPMEAVIDAAITVVTMTADAQATFARVG